MPLSGARRSDRSGTDRSTFQIKSSHAISNYAYAGAALMTGKRLCHRDLLALVDIAQALGDISDSAEFDWGVSDEQRSHPTTSLLATPGAR